MGDPMKTYHVKLTTTLVIMAALLSIPLTAQDQPSLQGSESSAPCLPGDSCWSEIISVQVNIRNTVLYAMEVGESRTFVLHGRRFDLIKRDGLIEGLVPFFKYVWQKQNSGISWLVDHGLLEIYGTRSKEAQLKVELLYSFGALTYGRHDETYLSNLILKATNFMILDGIHRAGRDLREILAS